MKRIASLTRFFSLCLFSLCLLSLCVWTATAEAANDKLMVWTASKPGATNTLTIFGSIHLATADIYPLRDDLLEAFNNADALVVEVNTQIIDPAAVQQWLHSNATYPAGDTLAKHLNPATLKSLRDYCENIGIPFHSISSYRPGWIAVLLTQQQLQRFGFHADWGLDNFFMQRAATKPILELESLQEQLSLLLNLGDDNTVIEQTLADLGQLENAMQEMLAYYQQGDDEKLQQQMFYDVLAEHPEFVEIYQRLFDQRNRAMAEKLDTFSRDGRDYFVVVGTGHLLGDNSILESLRKSGYLIQRF